MPRILHILPHRGGGGEIVVDVLSRLEAFEHERAYLSPTRHPLAAGVAIARGRPRLRRLAGAADILHVTGDTSALLTLPLLSRRPSVFSTQGLHLLRRSSGARGAVVRGGMRRVLVACRRTVCSSHAELAELRAALGDVGTPVVVHNGVEIPAERPSELRDEVRSELGLGEREVAVLYLGQLEARKEPLLLVEAAELAARRGQPVVLLVAGAGPLEEAVAARASASVRPLGFRRDPERLLAAADVFAMPSSREGLSLAVLEAMAAGVPPVVSDGPGNPEAVGDAGRVVRAGDAGALADALAGLAADRAERERLGAEARLRARERFSVERYLADMQDVFAATLEGRPPAHAP